MIRPATLNDAQTIAETHVASWQAAYEGLMPDAFLARLSVERRFEMWQEILRQEQNNTYVAEENGRVLGFMNYGPCRDHDLNPETVAELYCIYLLPEAWGKGYGRALCNQALSSMREDGYIEASLWVLQNNEGAITFYERAGFQADEASKIEQWDDITLTEKRYRRQL